MTDTDRQHMRHALSLAARGLGRVWPNPAVGCVIVNDGRVVGRGRTVDGGRPHAETQALAVAGHQAAGATVYVTLEPCAHQGQTPPCVDALISAGVGRVVIACGDPDPRVAGKGIEKLKKAGIPVTTNFLDDEAQELQKGFLSRVRLGRPTLTLKLGMTLDGRIATASGESQWITGPDARRDVHRLRSSHDAVLIGAGTARTDDPMLTVRGFGNVPQPIRVVASRHLRLLDQSQLMATASETPVWLICGDDAAQTDVAETWRENGAELIPVDTQHGQIAPRALLSALGSKGITRVFCEGGGTLGASLLAEGCVDDLVVFTAGKLLGAEGQPGVGALGLSALSDAPEFELVSVQRIGNDVRHHWRRPVTVAD